MLKENHNLFLLFIVCAEPMHLTLKQLQFFESAARLRSYTRAAEELNLTQPAVYIQVKRLAEAIGLPLFEQIGKSVALTETGEMLLKHTRAIFEEIESIEAKAFELKGLNRGRLRIANVTTVNYFVPILLRTFCERFPGIEISVEVANRQELLHDLSENTADIGIMGRPPEDLDLIAEPFLENPLVIVAPPTHPLAKERNISLGDMANQVFLMRERGSGTRGAMQRFFAEHEIEVRSSIEVSGAEAQKQGVQAGLGLALISRDAVELEVTSGRLVELPVSGMPIQRAWYIVHRAGKHLSPATQAFKKFILREAATLLDRSSHCI